MSIEPLMMECPGSWCRGNLPDGATALCSYCNIELPSRSGLLPGHRTLDLLTMIGRGDLDGLTRHEAVELRDKARELATDG